jgi:hypothetical protein
MPYFVGIDQDNIIALEHNYFGVFSSRFLISCNLLCDFESINGRTVE